MKCREDIKFGWLFLTRCKHALKFTVTGELSFVACNMPTPCFVCLSVSWLIIRLVGLSHFTFSFFSHFLRSHCPDALSILTRPDTWQSRRGWLDRSNNAKNARNSIMWRTGGPMDGRTARLTDWHSKVLSRVSGLVFLSKALFHLFQFGYSEGYSSTFHEPEVYLDSFLKLDF